MSKLIIKHFLFLLSSGVFLHFSDKFILGYKHKS